MHGRSPTVAMTALALAALVGAGGSVGTGAAAGAAERPLAGEVEQALVAEMNRVRAQNSRPALRTVATLSRPARAHSRVVLSTGVLTHDSPDGTPFWQRLVNAGFPRNRAMAENLAVFPGCDAVQAARQTVRRWMNSPGHRANLLGRPYRWTGAGAAVAPDCRRIVITADYGS
jgi:uncharacterized protein YkwD